MLRGFPPRAAHGFPPASHRSSGRGDVSGKPTRIRFTLSVVVVPDPEDLLQGPSPRQRDCPVTMTRIDDRFAEVDGTLELQENFALTDKFLPKWSLGAMLPPLDPPKPEPRRCSFQPDLRDTRRSHHVMSETPLASAPRRNPQNLRYRILFHSLLCTRTAWVSFPVFAARNRENACPMTTTNSSVKHSARSRTLKTSR